MILGWNWNGEDSSFSILDESFVGITSTPTTMERIGNHFYTRFLLNLNHEIRHLRICGMTQSSANQHAKGLHQCLKLLKSIVSYKNFDLEKYQDKEKMTNSSLKKQEYHLVEKYQNTNSPYKKIDKKCAEDNFKTKEVPKELSENTNLPEQEEVKIEASPITSEVIAIIPMLVANCLNPTLKNCQDQNITPFLNSFEHKFLKAINSIQGSTISETKNIGLCEDLILVLRGTFEDLIGGLPIDKMIKNNVSQSKKVPCYNPYPFEAAIAQIDTTLDILTMLLRIERLCHTRQRIKEVLVNNESDDEQVEGGASNLRLA